MKQIVALLAIAIVVFQVIAANVTLAWNPSCDQIVAGYNVYYGSITNPQYSKPITNYDKCSGTYSVGYAITNAIFTNKISTTGTSYTISNLQAGVTYDFCATTFSAAGAESAFSLAVTYTVPRHTNHPPYNLFIN